MKISVAIPAFASTNYKGGLFLKDLINSVLQQTYVNYEIVVSDHSDGNEIFEVVLDFIEKTDIVYFRNKEKKGNISANTNNAILKCSGDIIKVLHVDDKICNNNLFQQIIDGFKSNPKAKWGACAFNHIYDNENNECRYMIPDTNGIIGNPSVSFFVNDKSDMILYDENLKYILDEDFHKRLLNKYNSPIIISDTSITIRMHDSQASKTLNKFHQEDIDKINKRKNGIFTNKTEEQKHIVIGGAGFIGSHIVDHLVDSGNNVLIIDNLLTGKIKNINPQSCFLKLNVSDENNIKVLEKHINKGDVIYNLAAIARVQPSIQNPIGYNKNNTNGVLNVLYAAYLSKAKRVIFSSSSSVYGDTQTLPTHEDVLTNPLSPYGLQKLIGEQYNALFSKVYGLDTVSLRYFNVYGERMVDEGAYCTVIGTFSKQLKNGEKLTITNNGEQKRDFTYVKDVVRANILAAKNEDRFNGDVFNIGSGINYTINQIADFIGGEKEYVGNVTEPYETLSDNKKAKEVLKWNPKGNVEMWIKNNVK